MEPLPSPAVWEQPWFLDLVKQLGGLLLVVMLILFVLKPTMMRLTAKPGENEDEDESAEGEGTDLDDEELQAALMEGAEGGVAALEGGEESLQLTGPEQYQDMLEAAKEMVQEDSKRVAQVVKRWVAEDAG
ncbi:MAG: hypothetical protein GY703_15540 [Gammaproteobacteria bacterium]|nr:hypothetical protein [Gammaproteobacteria bacterium]